MNVAAMAPAPVASARTAPPGGTRPIALYDGHCRFCTRQVKTLQRIVGRDRLETRSFQDDGVLATFPGIPYDAAMARMHIVTPDGRVYAGAEAAARAIARIPWVGWLAYVYYVPGLRQLAELTYRWIAKNRYRLMGRTSECDPNGTCHLHR
jgi:predicted DCC family thiol-disulfide oxidoreductase YuxK